jgi:hypothetical protein
MIKNWKSFNESQLDLFDPYIPGRKKNYLETYPYDEEQILDLLIDFEDEGYSIWVEHGFADYRRNNKTGIFFTTETVRYRVTPTTAITIGSSSKTSDNITPSFKTFYNRIKTHFKEIHFFDNEVELNRENLTFEGEIKHRGKDLDGNLFIMCLGEETTVNDKFIFEYYGISTEKVRFTEQGKAIVKLDRDFLIGRLHTSIEQYVDYLNRSEEPKYNLNIPTHYQVLSLMSIENLKKLIEKSDIRDTDSIYHDVELFKKLPWKFQELGELLNPKYYDKIVNLYDKMDRESYREKFFKILESEFQKWIEKVLKTKVIKSYTEDGKDYYDIQFQIDWINSEYENLYRKKIDDIIDEYDDNLYEKFSPNMDFYGSPDPEKFNKVVTEILKGSSKT